MTVTTACTLAPEAVLRIHHAHRLRVGDHPQHVATDELLLYRLDGSLVGSSLQPEAQGVDLDRFVCINASRLPDVDELEAVTIDEEGVVRAPESLRRWRRHEPETGGPAPADRPTAVRPVRHAGPLSEHVRRRIASQHYARLPRHVREPGKGRAAPYDPPVDHHAYSALDGRHLGSVHALPAEADPSKLVILATDQLPDDLLARMVVRDDGRVEVGQ